MVVNEFAKLNGITGKLYYIILFDEESVCGLDEGVCVFSEIENLLAYKRAGKIDGLLSITNKEKLAEGLEPDTQVILDPSPVAGELVEKSMPVSELPD